ncbi:MmcQ/YjbR family DNA-binding protein [Nocardioides montaniterrae]
MAVVDDVRPLGSELERSYIAYVRGALRFRVGQIVYVGFSPDERVMGFAFPKEERDALVGGDPRFSLPRPSDLRFNWVHADLAALDPAEARELVVDAWRMVVPQKCARAYDLTHPGGPG